MLNTKDILGQDFKPPRKILIWQNRAIEIANELGFKLTKTWFAFFKRAYLQGQQGYIEATFRSLVDLNKEINEKYFFGTFYKKLRKEN